MSLIVFDDSEQLESDFTDIHLQFIQFLFGPVVKDKLLTRAVVINVSSSDESG